MGKHAWYLFGKKLRYLNKPDGTSADGYDSAPDLVANLAGSQPHRDHVNGDELLDVLRRLTDDC